MVVTGALTARRPNAAEHERLSLDWRRVSIISRPQSFFRQATRQ